MGAGGPIDPDGIAGVRALHRLARAQGPRLAHEARVLASDDGDVSPVDVEAELRQVEVADGLDQVGQGGQLDPAEETGLLLLLLLLVAVGVTS